MQVWIAVFNVDTGSNDGIKELEDVAELYEEIDILMDAFFMRHDVTAMVVDEAKKATASMVTEWNTNTVKNTIVPVVQVVYTSGYEGIKAPIYHLMDGAVIEAVQ